MDDPWSSGSLFAGVLPKEMPGEMRRNRNFTERLRETWLVRKIMLAIYPAGVYNSGEGKVM